MRNFYPPESMERLRAAATKHGGDGTTLYRRWIAMKTRCTNPNRPEWPRYGGRGITVCPEWIDDFPAFRDWALANGYAPELSLDRVDNDRGYSPTNCRWATMSQQTANTRRGCLPDGRRKKDVAAAHGVTMSAVRNRIYHGWDELSALTTPLKYESPLRGHSRSGPSAA